MASNAEDFIEKLASYGEKVQDLFCHANKLHFRLESLDDCESPIEQLFLIALQVYEQDLFIKDEIYFVFAQQEELEINGREYRVDFLITFANKNTPGQHQRLIIECDGHDFHEKTKEQAARDKKRDRDFLATGIPTMRFTGSEIWNNLGTCIKEVAEFISRKTEGGNG